MANPVTKPQLIPVPSLQGLPPQKTEEFLRTVAQAVNKLAGNSPDLSTLLTKSTAASLYSPAVIRAQLQAGGSAPLNLTSLPGVVAQAQSTNVPYVTALPTSGPLRQDGVLVSFNGVLYRFNATPAPGVWVAQGAVAVDLVGTKADRLANYPPADYPIGTQFYETDTELLYIQVGGIWTNVIGPLLLNGTHANRLSSTPSVSFALYTGYYETDRTVQYWVQNATGTLTVAGGVNVTWVSGNHFINTGAGFDASQWPAGTRIVIAGVTCTIAAVTSPTALTLQVATTNGAGVAYSVSSGRWVYLQSVYSSTLANLPVDLGENDVNFLYFENVTFLHQTRWTGTGWVRGPGDLEHSDTFHEFGVAPTDPGWYPCDGTATTFFVYTNPAVPVARTTPNTVGSPAYAKGGAAYNATITGATLPTVTTTVSAGSAATSGTGSAETAVITPLSVLTPPLTGGGGGGGTNIAGTVTLPDDPVQYYSIIKFYRR